MEMADTNRHEALPSDSTQITGRVPGRTDYPIYDATPLGFHEYWYPVLFSGQLRGKQGMAFTLLGESIVFFREQGKAYALHNRCPHRGVPLAGRKHAGRRLFFLSRCREEPTGYANFARGM